MTDEIVTDDFNTMRNMLSSIESKMKTHINKAEVFHYYQPIKQMILEAWLDLSEHGKPTFTNNNKA